MEYGFVTANELRQSIEEQKRKKREFLIQGDKIKIKLNEMIQTERYSCFVKDIRFEELNSDLKKELEEKGYDLRKDNNGYLIIMITK